MPKGKYIRSEKELARLKGLAGNRRGTKYAKFSSEHRKHIGDSQRGKKKVPRSDEHKRRLSESQSIHSSFIGKSGTLHPRWKGGKRSPLTKLRGTREYKLWRKAVIERDNHRCVMCFSDKELHADHLKSFADYPELRLAIDNGRTLCKNCHMRTENYGGRIRNIRKS